MPRAEYTVFTDCLVSSSFFKYIIETSSSKIRAKLNEILTSFDEDSSQHFYLNPEKSFAIASGDPSSDDITSLSTSKDVSHVCVESSPFDSSKHVLNVSIESSTFDSSEDSSHLCPSCQEVISLTKGEKGLELDNVLFFLNEELFSAHLPFKKRPVFFEK